MTHRLHFAARSDRGLLRANNQDSVYAGDRLLIVADGMGGHAAGDLASRVVVAAFAPLDARPPGEDLLAPLRRAIYDGNDAIAELVESDPELDGMGTTCTALLFDGDRVGIAHVGDSRCYLYRDNRLQQLSHDDTFVQSLVDEGRITEEEASHHPQRNLLLRALNGTDAEPWLSTRSINVGDRYLICSDGLSSVVGAEAIADALAGTDPDSAADQLVELALVAGGPDNVTVVVADVTQVGERAGSTGAGGAAGSGETDLDATGPIQPIHVTQRMPRVPLPPIPEEPGSRPEYVPDTDSDGADRDADGRPPADPDEADDGYGGYQNSDGDGQDDNPDGAAAERGERRGTSRGAGLPVPARRRPMPAAPRSSRWYRRSALAFGILALVGVIIGAVIGWTRTQYYVGLAGDRVVVYRGVDGSVFGIRLASAEEDSCAVGLGETTMPNPAVDPAAADPPAANPPAPAENCVPLRADDLVQTARDQLAGGIPAGDLTAARTVMTQLGGELLPICPPVDQPRVPAAGGSTTSVPSVPSRTSGRPSPEPTKGADRPHPAPADRTGSRTPPAGSTASTGRGAQRPTDARGTAARATTATPTATAKTTDRRGTAAATTDRRSVPAPPVDRRRVPAATDQPADPPPTTDRRSVVAEPTVRGNTTTETRPSDQLRVNDEPLNAVADVGLLAAPPAPPAPLPAAPSTGSTAPPAATAPASGPTAAPAASAAASGSTVPPVASSAAPPAGTSEVTSGVTSTVNPSALEAAVAAGNCRVVK